MNDTQFVLSSLQNPYVFAFRPTLYHTTAPFCILENLHKSSSILQTKIAEIAYRLRTPLKNRGNVNRLLWPLFPNLHSTLLPFIAKTYIYKGCSLPSGSIRMLYSSLCCLCLISVIDAEKIHFSNCISLFCISVMSIKNCKQHF